jgi:hypothetical protein
MFDDNAKDPSAFAFACKSVALRVSTKWIFSLTFQEGVVVVAYRILACSQLQNKTNADWAAQQPIH